MPLLITIVAIDNEETHAKEGFSLKIVSWGQDRGDKNNPPLPLLILFLELVTDDHLLMKVLKQKNALDKFITNVEAYLELSQIYVMKLFCKNS